MQDRGDELSRQEKELKVVRDELIRTAAVAQRVAASETRGGNKDEGVVPVAMHLEEVKVQTAEACTRSAAVFKMVISS